MKKLFVALSICLATAYAYAISVSDADLTKDKRINNVDHTKINKISTTPTPTPTATPTATNTPTPTPTNIPLLTNLVAYWKMDEASGTRADATLRGNDLTDNNTVTSATGIINNGGIYTSVNSEWLSLADNTDLAPGSAFSISFWYLWATSAVSGMINKDDYLTDRSWLIEGDSGPTTSDIKFYFATSINDPAVHYGVTSSIILENTWTHIVWVYDGSQSTDATRLKCYINASLQTLTFSGSAVPASLVDNTSELSIGRRLVSGAGFRYLNGGVDEVGLWKGRALSGASVAVLYNSGAGLAYPF